MTRHFPILLIIVALLIGAGVAVPAAAQDLPEHIPDGTGEGLDEQNAERLEERHRSLLSSLFATTSLGTALPAFNVAPGLTKRIAGGYEFRSGDALAASITVYRLRNGEAYRDIAGEPSAFGRVPVGRTVYLLTLRYELGLRRFAGASQTARRTSVAFGFNMSPGQVGAGLGASITPQYTLPINARWSLPVGLRVGGIMLGEEQVRHFFVGVHAGVMLHFGRREQMR